MTLWGVSKWRIIVVSVAILLLSLYIYRPPIAGIGITTQSVEASLRTLGYEACGIYTAKPGEDIITFTGEFREPVKCFLIIKRPSDKFIFGDPTLNMIIEPSGDEVAVYRYNVGIRFFWMLRALSIDQSLKPFVHVGVGRINITTWIPADEQLRSANDEAFVVFSYKPEGDEGFPVKITVIIRAVFKEGNAPAGPSMLERVIGRIAWAIMDIWGRLPSPYTIRPDESKTAVKLGIKDIKELMSYFGYELCGEYWAENKREHQRIIVEMDIDLNEGKACYILIHPPTKDTTFLILKHNMEIISVGDEGQRARYEDKIGTYIGTRYRFLAIKPLLGIGITRIGEDVVKPYTERIGVGLDSGSPTRFIDNTGAIIYFSYKGDPAFGEQFRFWLRVRIEVVFQVIPAERVGEWVG